jgi:hypothetical protein
MPIRHNGQTFDLETTRILGVAFEIARTALRLADGDPSEAMVAQRITELVKAGERDPDLLCERVLFEFAKPSLKPAEYHLIDLATGLSHGEFRSLAAARQCARDEAVPAWQIFRGNVRIEQHDPR